jgi:tetratricopeptide (TPR) repeat protein
MIIKKISLLLFAGLLALPIFGQQTSVYTEANLAYKQGASFYDKGLFAKARDEFKNVINLLQPINEPASEMLRIKAELNYAKCAVHLDLPDGEKLILDFIRNYSPDPLANQALVELANYYYNAEKFDKAIEYYSKVPLSGMSREKRAEVRFRMGYSYFVNKEFSKALNNFKEIKDLETEYYYPTNYYLGLCYFFDGNYNEAIRSFRVVEKSKKYDSHVPYYICQIYFAERRYDELIAYASTKVGGRSLNNEKEIRQLLGQAYFEKGDYQNALPHLEYYAERSGKLREEEFYQLGFTQYQTGNYDKAIRSFKELSRVDSRLGQSAMYYLADCYLRAGQKVSARAAFVDAKRMNYDPQIREEALFNYAKLSYELKDPREAVISLQGIPPASANYNAAQSLLGEVLLSYRDYKQAIEVIEKIPNKTIQLQESYQKVTFYRGIQLTREENYAEARRHFEKSMEYPVDQRIKAQAIFWLGDIAFREKQYNTSIKHLNQFLTLAKTMTNLPDESSIFTANYIQGYNYLKQENYPSAAGFFQDAVTGIKRNSNFIRSQIVKRDVLGDATMRTGDCYFKRNQYNQAVQFYDEAINNKYAGYVYAIFQKAIIEGLRGKTTEKILALERVANEFPDSEYADDALLQLGITFQEIGQLNRSIAPLRKLVTDYRNKSPLVNQGLLQLGLVSYNQGNMETAINYYKQVFTNNPEPSEANFALAALEEIYVSNLGRADDYFAFLETIPGYKLDNFARDSINFKAAESQFENANYNRAVEAYTDYLRKFPNGRYTLTANYHRGESYSVLRNYSEALKDYEAVIEKGPSRFYLKALEKAAIIAYNHEQNFNKSYDFYTKLEAAALTGEERFEAQLGALRSAYRIGNASAVYSLATKVTNNSSASVQQVATANFFLGKMAFDQKDYDNAMTAFNKVIQTSDNEQTAEARYLKAYIYYLKRDLETAQQITINSNKESSAYPYWVAKSVILLSDILTEKGDLYNARAALEALLDNYKDDAELINEARTKLARINQQLNQSSRLSNDTDTKRLELDKGDN